MSNTQIQRQKNRFPQPASLAASLVGLLVLLAAAAPLSADEASPWNVAVKYGQSRIDNTFVSGSLGWRIDDREPSVTVEAGYELTPFLGVQVAYHDFGSFAGLPGRCQADDCPVILTHLPQPGFVPDVPAEAEFTGFSVSAVPRLPLTERWQLYGKLGYLEWKGALSPSEFGAEFDDLEDRDVLYGAGTEIELSRGFGLSLEYLGSDLFDHVSLGASWRF